LGHNCQTGAYSASFGFNAEGLTREKDWNEPVEELSPNELRKHQDGRS
jgi:hypothetical protein